METIGEVRSASSSKATASAPGASSIDRSPSKISAVSGVPATERSSSKNSASELYACNSDSAAAVFGSSELGVGHAVDALEPEVKPGSPWIFCHRPTSPIVWKAVPSGLHVSLSKRGSRSTSAFIAMSNEDLDAHFENDYCFKLGIDAHRSDVRAKLARAATAPSSINGTKISSPSSGRAVPMPAVSQDLMLSPVSAWKLWGKPGRYRNPRREDEMWNDHFRTPKLARKDASGGPGQYCRKFMQREVWSPRRGEFQSIGRPRTKCGVSYLNTVSRWGFESEVRVR